MKKSRKSSVAMSLIAIVTSALVYALIQLLFFFDNLDAFSRPGLFSPTEIAIGLGIALAALAIGVALASLIIYRLKSTVWGWQGAVLWFIFGLLTGALLSLRSWLLPSLATIHRTVPNLLLYSLIRELFGLGVLLFTYWLTFKLLAPLLKWDAPAREP